MKRTKLFAIATALLLPLALLVTRPLWGQDAGGGVLDETCTVTVLGQQVQVNANGTFRIRNVPVGNPPPLVRATGTCDRGETTEYFRSDCFELVRNGTATVPTPLEFSPVPFPGISRILCPQPPAVLTEIGETAQLQVLALLTDNTQRDITSRSECTIYRTSNPRVCTVDENGLVTARGTGFAFLTIVNEGVSAVCPCTVSLGDPLTKVLGRVLLEDGVTPAVGADVATLAGINGTTGADGTFCLENVPSQQGNIVVTATLDTLAGSSDPTPPVPGGTTDVGDISLEVFDCPTIRIGEPFLNGTGNCFPFGCISNQQWQQVWDSSFFEEKIVIKSISIFNRGFSIGPVITADYTFIMATKPPGGVSSNFAANLGPDQATVLQGRFPDADHGAGLGPIRTFPLDTPFCYDPAEGDLVLYVLKTNIVGGATFFDTTNVGGVTRVFTPSPPPANGSVSTSGALVIEFNTPPGGLVIPQEAEPAAPVASDEEGYPVGE